MSTLKVNTINAATSGQAVDVDIKSPKSFRNLIINGQFQIWQRKTDSGASQTSTTFIADRWQINASGGTYQCTRQAFTEAQTDVPSYPQYYHRLSVTTGANDSGPRQKIEDVRSVQGQHTLSFWARGTNPAGGHLDAHIRQDYGDGGSTEETAILGAVTLNATSTTWTKYSFTFTPNSLSGKTIGDNSYFQVAFKQPTDDTGTAAWSLDLANVQVEQGSIASDFERRSAGDEAIRCYRYCYIEKANNGDYMGLNGLVTTSQAVNANRVLPVPMRTIPSYTGTATDLEFQSYDTTAMKHFDDGISAYRTPTTVPATVVNLKWDVSQTTAGHFAMCRCKEDGAQMIFSAEL